jgi:hypothetical protein
MITGLAIVRFRRGRSSARNCSHSVTITKASLNRKPVDAMWPAACASQFRTAWGLKDTPKANDDGASAEVEVVDAAHPLSGKRFRLVSIERSTCPESCARVEWRFGLTLLLPLHVTNLGPRRERPTTQTRLSVEALEELVATAEGSEGTCPSSLGTSGAICRPKSAIRSSTISPRSCGR